MLFKDILSDRTKILEPEFDRLLEDTFRNQTHIGDLLLAQENGRYKAEVLSYSIPGTKFSPFVIGPDKEGHSYNLHYEFIHAYRSQAIASSTYQEFQELIKYNPDKKEEVEALKKFEELTIQLEMLIYLKIWESDLFIKRLYQLASLAQREPFDWYFSISQSNRDSESTGTRENILRKRVRDRLSEHYPIISEAMKTAYRTQIRNSIAHSNYSFLSRHIHPNNHILDKESQIRSLPFEDWIFMFHDTMVIYYQVIRLFNIIHERYRDIAMENKNLIQVRLSPKDPSDTVLFNYLEYRPSHDDWGPQRKDP